MVRFRLLGLSILMSVLVPFSCNAKTLSSDVEIHRAIFTGYYPDSSKMEGGYRASNLEWLEPKDWTVAAPFDIPYDAKVTVCGTGNWRDGHTYRVNDRGGAIIVDGDGFYHIDILMNGKEQADRFGVKEGYIIVEK